MCRTDLGPCCAQDCPNRITCQDLGGYCNEHDPYDMSHVLACRYNDDNDDNECTCPPAPPRPPDDPARRRAYTISRYEVMVERERTALANAQHRVQVGEQTLAILRAEQKEETNG